MVLGEGFEPPKAEPDDLQSPVFDRFTIPARSSNASRLTLQLVYGAAYRTRTDDPRFTKPLLYQLS